MLSRNPSLLDSHILNTNPKHEFVKVALGVRFCMLMSKLTGDAMMHWIAIANYTIRLDNAFSG